MKEIRFHGRGGQGAVVASRILAEAAFMEGAWVQTFPFFGVERRGAPVTAYARIDQQKIRIKSEIYQPDYIVVLDPTLIGAVDVVCGLKGDGSILINTTKSPKDFEFKKDFKVATVDATAIALEYGIGHKTSPIVNTAMLGAFAKASGWVGLDSVITSIRKKILLKTEQNVKAAKEAYDSVIGYKLQIIGER